MSNKPAIRYVEGDATEPVGAGPKIIAHVCNDIGAWGAGFVVALSNKWPHVEDEFLNWARVNKPTLTPYGLGAVQYVPTYSLPNSAIDIMVANMVAQRGLGSRSNPTPLQYDFLERCLMHVAKTASMMGATVHGPRFGAGLAGGSWDTIEAIIEKTLVASGIYVTIYDLPKQPGKRK